MESDQDRRVVPVAETFFCDGAWYVLTSGDLGGSGMSAAELEERLQSAEAKPIADLISRGICLPLYFPGDCALDDAVIVIGDLDQEEEREWIGRMRSTLNIPSGEFVLVAGGLEEDFEAALSQDKPDIEGHESFEKVKVEPGKYLVEIYAFLGSMNVNFEWEDQEGDAEFFRGWWDRTRAGEPYPEWIASFLEEDYVDSEEFEFVEYVIRLKKLGGDEPAIQIPEQDEDTQWCNEFEYRMPDPCPVGIKRGRYLAG